jgi:hypothetical protein
MLGQNKPNGTMKKVNFEEHMDSEMSYLMRVDKNATFKDIPITAKARLSYYNGFGLLPNEQILYEKYFSNFIIDYSYWGPDKVISAKSYIHKQPILPIPNL